MEETPRPTTSSDLLEYFEGKIVGQPSTAERIIPFIQTYKAGLTSEHRPIGVFLLLGPTGTGKTRTVEVLAEALHGNAQRYLRIDCGEYQLDHEVAKLIGSPPGYLGHRETVPALSKQKLAESITPDCDISLVLFDEIEKAAPSLARLLLGLLDKGRLTLGDNTTVNFDKSLIFLTSNLGAREMMREMTPTFGFGGQPDHAERAQELAGKLESIALAAVKKMFSPEFVNRIDAVITYQPLSEAAIAKILEHQIDELQHHVNSRLGPRCFSIEVTQSARDFLLGRGVSVQYGARELKRVVYRFLTQPLATMVAENLVPPGSTVIAGVDAGNEKIDLQVRLAEHAVSPAEKPALLIVDDNAELLKYLKNVLKSERWEVRTAASAEAAVRCCEEQPIALALVDYMLPGMDGLALSKRLRATRPSLQLILMTGGGEMSVNEESGLGSDVPVLQKPFLIGDLVSLVQTRMQRGDADGALTVGSR
ncbi:MAG: ATPase domain protein [Bryobacterales bacterium]|jgi:CheY-like chemotaxis protein/MoxR-like ATPase|nr:ATPase domain protein [Bryobacterales bacterium]